MRILRNNIFRIFCVFMFVCAILVIPSNAQALVPPLLPFGGWPVLPIPIPCTCSAALWTWFAPLYLGGSVPLTGPMTYVPYATYPMADYLPTVFLTPHLGSYIAGVPACWVGAPPYCYWIPNIGVMAFVGTGLPGGK